MKPEESAHQVLSPAANPGARCGLRGRLHFGGSFLGLATPERSHYSPQSLNDSWGIADLMHIDTFRMQEVCFKDTGDGPALIVAFGRSTTL